MLLKMMFCVPLSVLPSWVTAIIAVLMSDGVALLLSFRHYMLIMIMMMMMMIMRMRMMMIMMMCCSFLSKVTADVPVVPFQGSHV